VVFVAFVTNRFCLYDVFAEGFRMTRRRQDYGSATKITKTF